MEIVAAIFGVALVVDFILMLILPKFYVRVGIPLGSKVLPAGAFVDMEALKEKLLTAHPGLKFYSDETSVWYRAMFASSRIRRYANFTPTKAIFIREGDELRCVHVLGLTQLLAFLLLAAVLLFTDGYVYGWLILGLGALFLGASIFIKTREFKLILETIAPPDEAPGAAD